MNAGIAILIGLTERKGNLETVSVNGQDIVFTFLENTQRTRQRPTDEPLFSLKGMESSSIMTEDNGLC